MSSGLYWNEARKAKVWERVASERKRRREYARVGVGTVAAAVILTLRVASMSAPVPQPVSELSLGVRADDVGPRANSGDAGPVAGTE